MASHRQPASGGRSSACRGQRGGLGMSGRVECVVCDDEGQKWAVDCTRAEEANDGGTATDTADTVPVIPPTSELHFPCVAGRSGRRQTRLWPSRHEGAQRRRSWRPCRPSLWSAGQGCHWWASWPPCAAVSWDAQCGSNTVSDHPNLAMTIPQSTTDPYGEGSWRCCPTRASGYSTLDEMASRICYHRLEGERGAAQ